MSFDISLAGKTSPYGSHSDRELVAMCIDGDRAAWDTLIDRYHNRIYSIAVKFRLDPSECEDVVQNVGIALQRGLHTLEDRSKFYPWLITIVRRECIALLRRREEDLAPEPGIDERLDPGPTLEEAIVLTEKHQTLREAVATLGPPCSLLIQMIYFEHRTFADTAARLNCSPDGIGPTRVRCFAKLRKLLLRREVTGA
jgi:RNA polymerase sigma factor (sigma-70 family)